jgi:SAM-dependent methyltransferase
MARRLPEILRTSWTRVALRNVHFADKHRRLNNLYCLRDPWEMETERQRFRFQETNRLIEANFGRVRRILEVGCGEGHQSQELLHVCDELVGIDVSARAVQRARERCPDATFEVGDVFAFTPSGSGRPFDLVLGCEVLYYVRDVAAALERFCELGNACLVSYYEGPAARLDPYVSAMPGVESTTVGEIGSSWKVSWWRNG